MVELDVARSHAVAGEGVRYPPPAVILGPLNILPVGKISFSYIYFYLEEGGGMGTKSGTCRTTKKVK